MSSLLLAVLLVVVWGTATYVLAEYFARFVVRAIRRARDARVAEAASTARIGWNRPATAVEQETCVPTQQACEIPVGEIEKQVEQLWLDGMSLEQARRRALEQQERTGAMQGIGAA